MKLSQRLTLPFLVASLLAAGSIGRAREKCKNLVSYSGTTWKISGIPLPGEANLKGLDIERKRELLQTAEKLAQIFDGVQYATCGDLNRVEPQNGKGSWGDYAKIVLERSNALLHLAELQSILATLQENQGNTGEGGKKLAAWIASANGDVQKTPPATAAGKPKPSEVQSSLDKVKGDVIGVVSRMETTNPKPTWDMLSEQTRKDIVQQLKDVISLLSLPLNIQVDDLSAGIRMSGGDGFLYRPEGLAVRGQGQLEEGLPKRIPLYYGAAGVAYAEGTDQVVVIPKDGEDVTFRMGKDDPALASQRRARAILVTPEMIRTVTSRWVISIPIKNTKEETIAVLNITSNIERSKDQLNAAYERSQSALLTKAEAIAKLILGKQ